VKTCPLSQITKPWDVAQKALKRYVELGVELEKSYRYIARHDEVGMTASLLPNARTQVAGARKSYRTALADMGERLGSKHLAFVLTAVTIQRQIGGSLAGLFDMVADTVRQRQQFARKIRSLTAMGRMSAYVLGGLPFAVAVLISLINPSYMEPPWHSSRGHQMVGAGLVMLGIGGAFLKKIVSFKG